MSILVPGLSLPLRTLFGVGRNYAAHARELGNAVPPEPLIFLKPVSSVVLSGGEIRLPAGIGRVDYEGEIVAAIGKGGRHIDEGRALGHVAGFAVGIDVTARDLQTEAKKKGQPWAISKGYDSFAALGNFVPASGLDAASLRFTLAVNEEVRQSGDAAAMESSVARLVSFLSRIFTLAPGDLIFTGTPEGVGPLHPGDRVTMELEGTAARLEVTVR
jgi:2-keto-4-pentenoate hydratase/2-oxohepta-3-ene-1,7-dioic acid hydratase in catechol pathway